MEEKNKIIAQHVAKILSKLMQERSDFVHNSLHYWSKKENSEKGALVSDVMYCLMGEEKYLDKMEDYLLQINELLDLNIDTDEE